MTRSRYRFAACGGLFVAACVAGGLVFGAGHEIAPSCRSNRATLSVSPDRDHEGDEGWFPFEPGPDPFSANSVTDLRFLNERFAGEHGFIGVEGGQFIHGGNGLPVRFWAVTGPPSELQGADLRRCARLLAKYGVNLVRIHVGYFDDRGEVDLARVKHSIEIVEAMKTEGIYTLFSVYFPLWLRPAPGTAWLQGYDGRQPPFAALFFNSDFQAQYRSWWTALLTTRSPATGRRLVDDPAVAGLEMLNEDSLFFWTLETEAMPDPQAQLLEKAFGDWLVKRHGSLAAALARWEGVKAKRDSPTSGRIGVRPLRSILREKTDRDRETVQFLFEIQTRFYRDTYAFLRQLGFKGSISASNWVTASPEVLGPLEKLSYSVGDLIDRHGYFSCNAKGPESEWSIRNGHAYADRSALRFDAEEPDMPKQFVHPVMDPHYDGKPSMISETTWTRPNRFRSEAPLYLAAYGALQHSDAIVHFALDGTRWTVKPQFHMQPWTLMTPAMMGQFPGAALIFRRGLVTTGPVLAEVSLNQDSLLRLQGTPLPQDAALDELRLKDVPQDARVRPDQRLDPLLHYAGRVDVRFTATPSVVKQSDFGAIIQHGDQTVTSATRELKLDYGKGVLIIDAARVQGVSGGLESAGSVQTKDLVISSSLDLGHIVVVSLDDLPLGLSRRMLLQVMSEEKPSGFRTDRVSNSVKRITSVGTDPWLVKEFTGTVSFRRPDAARLRVTALDLNGYAAADAGSAERIVLLRRTVYYLVGR
jgi:hypothetical protein